MTTTRQRPVPPRRRRPRRRRRAPGPLPTTSLPRGGPRRGRRSRPRGPRRRRPRPPRSSRRRRPPRPRRPRPPRSSRPSAPAAPPEVPARPGGRRADPLAEYRAKRDPARTAEPVPPAGQPLPAGNEDTFVVQEHHTPRGRARGAAERVHWDLRLERDGVLKSWAVPKGPPLTTGSNRLAVPTEDHPPEYASFAGAIAAGEYGRGPATLSAAAPHRPHECAGDPAPGLFCGHRPARAAGPF